MEKSKSEKIRLAAAQWIVERGYGKAVQLIDGEVSHVVAMGSVKVNDKPLELRIG